MTNFKTIMLACVCAISSAASAQSILPAQHTTLADEKSEMSKIVTTTFLDQSLEDVAKASPFAGIADMCAPAAAEPALAGSLVSYSKRFLGTPYVWGSTGPKSFDCSGFIGYVYRNFGINLDRTSRQQYLQGDRVNMGELQPGDLLFFSSRSSGRGNVGHVAMVVSVDKENNSCRFIHASCKKGVTYQNFPDGAYYSRNFIGARRILGSKTDTASAARASKEMAQN